MLWETVFTHLPVGPLWQLISCGSEKQTQCQWNKSKQKEVGLCVQKDANYANTAPVTHRLAVVHKLPRHEIGGMELSWTFFPLVIQVVVEHPEDKIHTLMVYYCTHFEVTLDWINLSIDWLIDQQKKHDMWSSNNYYSHFLSTKDKKKVLCQKLKEEETLTVLLCWHGLQVLDSAICRSPDKHTTTHILLDTWIKF